MSYGQPWTDRGRSAPPETIDPQAAFDEFWQNYQKKRDALNRPGEDAAAAAKSKQINDEYDAYMLGRGGKPVTYGNAEGPGGAWVNDAGRYQGEGKYGAATQGNAWDDYRNMGRDTQTIGRGTEFEEQVPSFRQLARRTVFDDNGNVLGESPTPYSSPSIGAHRQFEEESMQGRLNREQTRNLGPWGQMPESLGQLPGKVLPPGLLDLLKRFQVSSGGISPYNAPWQGPRYGGS
jgi:hypothetical protein